MQQDKEKNVVEKTMYFFDKLEDHVRARLSRHPILYSLIGGVAVVLFWRGVWMLADEIGLSSYSSIIISVVLMLMTGLFVSFFVGDQVILSGLKRDKKLIEKTEEEVVEETATLADVKTELRKIERDLEHIEHDVHGTSKS